MIAAPQNSMCPLTRDRPSRVTVVDRYTSSGGA